MSQSSDKQTFSDEISVRKIVPLKEKFFFGVGGISETLVSNIIFNMAMPIYSIALGVDAALIGLAISIPRFWDAFTDPLMGNISDNTRSRWGRRKPYIFIGAILTAIFCVAMWAPPTSLSQTQLFWYFLVISILYFTSSTVFQVPYNAIGYELSDDYDERTKVMSYKMFIMCVGGIFLLPWAYKLCFKFGSNEVEGARVVGLIFGFVIMLTGITPSLFCKEKFHNAHQEKIPFFRAFSQTLKNKAFIVLCGAIFFILIGFFVANPLLIYINIAYVCNGDKEMAATMFGYSTFTYGVLGFVCIPLISWAAGKWGKKAVLLTGIFFVVLGFGASWFYFNENHPYLQLLFGVFASPGMSCVWILTASCVADICDIDELETGMRREGMYGAVFAWLLKAGLASVLLISGFIVKWSGFDSNIAVQSDSAILRLRLMFAFAPIIFLLCAAICMYLYPITKEKIQEVQSLLREKKVAVE